MADLPTTFAGPGDGASRADRINTLPVEMAAALRRRGVPVPVDSTVSFARALAAVGLGGRTWVYWSGRATLVTRLEDVAAYDEAFEALWTERPSRTGPDRTEEEHVELPLSGADQAPDGPRGGEDDGDWEEVALAASTAERLNEKDFARCSPDELAEVQRLMRAMRIEAAHRRSRRWRRSGRTRGRPDIRRTMAAAIRFGGEVPRPLSMMPVTRPRRVVLLCDVSGSMELYARVLIRLLHVAVAGGDRIEAFALGTRLTRLTRHLASHDPDASLAAVAAAVPDWSGGTRLGQSLRAFNDQFGVRGMARGADVVILSDGWDRGEPEVLGAEMARLRRVAHRLIWVNPMKATPGYEPLARGMAAALPHVDTFLEGHSLASVRELVDVLEDELGSRRR